VLACGGTWVFGKQSIRTGNFAEITRATRETMDLVARTKPV
jgi:2-keto-3-deoxy-6-phosphogluconate aldolase